MQYNVGGGGAVQCIAAVECWGGFRHRSQVNWDRATKVEELKKKSNEFATINKNK